MSGIGAPPEVHTGVTALPKRTSHQAGRAVTLSLPCRGAASGSGGPVMSTKVLELPTCVRCDHVAREMRVGVLNEFTGTAATPPSIERPAISWLRWPLSWRTLKAASACSMCSISSTEHLRRPALTVCQPYRQHGARAAGVHANHAPHPDKRHHSERTRRRVASHIPRRSLFARPRLRGRSISAPKAIPVPPMGTDACLIVRDANGQALAYVYYE